MGQISVSLAAAPCSPFVPDEHDDHVAVAVLPGVLQPGGQVVEGVAPRDVVHEQRARRPAVVGPRDRPECLLPGLATIYRVTSVSQYGAG